MNAGARAFRLEIDPSVTPLSGRLTPERSGTDGAPVAFTGWTGLAATLERLLGEAGSHEPARNVTPEWGEERNG